MQDVGTSSGREEANVEAATARVAARVIATMSAVRRFPLAARHEVPSNRLITGGDHPRGTRARATISGWKKRPSIRLTAEKPASRNSSIRRSMETA